MLDRFPKWLWQSVFSSAAYESSRVSTSQPTLAVVFLIIVVLVGVKEHLIDLVLICISSMTNGEMITY